jgi:3'-5' exoribonuclease
MERTAIIDLSPGSSFDQVFICKGRQLRETRNGSLYLHLELSDASGKVPARMWDAPADILERFEEGFVRARGRAEVYKDNTQFIIDLIEPAASDGLDMAEFLPSTPYDVEQMFEDLAKAIEDVKNPHIKELLARIFADESIADKFKRAPAAVSIHQPYIGGLLEHTRSVLRAAYLLMKHYTMLDRDLIVAGVILHDIGKINELEYATAIRYSDYGELVGHIVDSVVIVERFAAQIEGFPRELLNRLVHLLVAHHGEREYGSPVLPKTPEAFFLHYLDNLDAKLETSTRAIREDTDPISHWTGWNNTMQRRFYKGAPGEAAPEE